MNRYRRVGTTFAGAVALLLAAGTAWAQGAPAPSVTVRYADPANTVKIGDSVVESQPIVVEVHVPGVNGAAPPPEVEIKFETAGGTTRTLTIPESSPGSGVYLSQPITVEKGAQRTSFVGRNAPGGLSRAMDGLAAKDGETVTVSYAGAQQSFRSYATDVTQATGEYDLAFAKLGKDLADSVVALQKALRNKNLKPETRARIEKAIRVAKWRLAELDRMRTTLANPPEGHGLGIIEGTLYWKLGIQVAYQDIVKADPETEDVRVLRQQAFQRGDNVAREAHDRASNGILKALALGMYTAVANASTGFIGPPIYTITTGKNIYGQEATPEEIESAALNLAAMVIMSKFGPSADAVAEGLAKDVYGGGTAPSPRLPVGVPKEPEAPATSGAAAMPGGAPGSTRRVQIGGVPVPQPAGMPEIPKQIICNSCGAGAVTYVVRRLKNPAMTEQVVIQDAMKAGAGYEFGIDTTTGQIEGGTWPKEILPMFDQQGIKTKVPFGKTFTEPGMQPKGGVNVGRGVGGVAPEKPLGALEGKFTLADAQREIRDGNLPVTVIDYRSGDPQTRHWVVIEKVSSGTVKNGAGDVVITGPYVEVVDVGTGQRVAISQADFAKMWYPDSTVIALAPEGGAVAPGAPAAGGAPKTVIGGGSATAQGPAGTSGAGAAPGGTGGGQAGGASVPMDVPAQSGAGGSTGAGGMQGSTGGTSATGAGMDAGGMSAGGTGATFIDNRLVVLNPTTNNYVEVDRNGNPTGKFFKQDAGGHLAEVTTGAAGSAIMVDPSGRRWERWTDANGNLVSMNDMDPPRGGRVYKWNERTRQFELAGGEGQTGAAAGGNVQAGGGAATGTQPGSGASGGTGTSVSGQSQGGAAESGGGGWVIVEDPSGRRWKRTTDPGGKVTLKPIDPRRGEYVYGWNEKTGQFDLIMLAYPTDWKKNLPPVKSGASGPAKGAGAQAGGTAGEPADTTPGAQGGSSASGGTKATDAGNSQGGTPASGGGSGQQPGSSGAGSSYGSPGPNGAFNPHYRPQFKDGKFVRYNPTTGKWEAVDRYGDATGQVFEEGPDGHLTEVSGGNAGSSAGSGSSAAATSGSGGSASQPSTSSGPPLPQHQERPAGAPPDGEYHQANDTSSLYPVSGYYRIDPNSGRPVEPLQIWRGGKWVKVEVDTPDGASGTSAGTLPDSAIQRGEAARSINGVWTKVDPRTGEPLAKWDGMKWVGLTETPAHKTAPTTPQHTTIEVLDESTGKMVPYAPSSATEQKSAPPAGTTTSQSTGAPTLAPATAVKSSAANVQPQTAKVETTVGAPAVQLAQTEKPNSATLQSAIAAYDGTKGETAQTKPANAQVTTGTERTATTQPVTAIVAPTVKEAPPFLTDPSGRRWQYVTDPKTKVVRLQPLDPKRGNTSYVWNEKVRAFAVETTAAVAGSH